MLRVLVERETGFPSFEVTARLLHLTPRTLHRRLTTEGTSFRARLEQVRHRLAVEHLRSSNLSTGEIAWALGYRHQANFRRAFLTWEGVSPAQDRARVRRKK